MLPHRPFAAVLFDLDQTLLQTESLLDESVTQAVEALCGVTPSPAILLATRGLPDAGPTSWPVKTLALIGESAGASARPSPSAEELFTAADAIFSRSCGRATAMPGAEAAVAALAAAGIPQAIVTSSMRHAVALKRVAHEAKIFAHMRTIVCVEDVAPESKPHPRCYLLAAARLGVRPEDCIVVEDSLPGITAGVAAGCTVVAVPHPSHVAQATALGAALVLTSLEQWDVVGMLEKGVQARGTVTVGVRRES